MLGHEAFAGHGIRTEREAFGLRRAGHKNIDGVVQEGQDLNLVNLPEWHPGHDYASYRGALMGTLTPLNAQASAARHCFWRWGRLDAVLGKSCGGLASC